MCLYLIMYPKGSLCLNLDLMRIPYLGLSESIYINCCEYSFEPTVQDIYNKMNKITEKERAKLKKGAEYVGNEIKKGAEFIGHEIKGLAARAVPGRRPGLLMDFLANLQLGFSIASHRSTSSWRRRRVRGHLIGALPGIGPVSGRGAPPAAHLRHGTHLRDHHARRPVRRHHVRRHHHLGADQYAGRVGVGGDLHRRLSDGAAGPGGAGARRRRDRLVRRRAPSAWCSSC